MKRYAILCTGTRCYSAKLAQAMGLFFDRFSASVVAKHWDTTHVLVIHGAQTGADQVAMAQAALKGWSEIGIPYFDELGVEGGGQRDKCLVQLLKVLRDHGRYTALVWAFPDDRSIGTRRTIALAKQARFEPVVEELGPRRAEVPPG